MRIASRRIKEDPNFWIENPEGSRSYLPEKYIESVITDHLSDTLKQEISKWCEETYGTRVIIDYYLGMLWIYFPSQEDLLLFKLRFW